MSKEREELNEALAHWERLLACKTAQEFMQEGYAGESCALCMSRTEEDYCECLKRDHVCPIAIHSGEVDCDNTPYQAAAKQINFFIKAVDLDTAGEKDLNDAHNAIKAEIDFIKEVIKEEKWTKDYNVDDIGIQW